MLEQEGAIPKLFPQSWEHGIVQHLLVCWSIQSSFHWNWGAKPSSWKTTLHHSPPPSNITLGTTQLDKYCSPGNRQTQTSPSDCQMERRDSSLQRTGLHCSRVQWRRALHHCNRSFALHLLMYVFDAVARPWKPIPWSFLCTILELIKNSDMKFVATDYTTYYAPQHLLTPLHHFTWPTALWLGCCRSQLLPLCYNTTVEYLVVRKFHNWTCCTGDILSQYHAGIHSAPERDPFFHKCL